jgi:tRNA dimethylallyltransferase
VRGLLAAGVPLEAPAFAAIGYRDTAALVSGTLSEAAWAEKLLRETRHYAKRQEAWFRRESGLLPVRADRPDLVDFVALEARPLFLFSDSGEGG